jgi:hypothetical protein
LGGHRLLEFDGRHNAEDFLTQRCDQRSVNGPIWHNLVAVLSLPRPLLSRIEPLFSEVLDPWGKGKAQQMQNPKRVLHLLGVSVESMSLLPTTLDGSQPLQDVLLT